MAKKKPMPGEAPNYDDLYGGYFSESSLEGGPPTSDKGAIGRRDLSRMAGEYDTRRGRALEMRARNVENSNRLTRKTEREVALRKLQAAAEKPGASTYAKDRYRMARESGMVNRKKGGTIKKMATGGSVSSASKRGDGIAKKGHTKGKMV